MASPAPVTPELKARADCYPFWSGWFRITPEHHAGINFNGAMLSRSEEDYPLRGRVRLFDEGRVIAEDFTPELSGLEFYDLSLNTLAGNQALPNAYAEVTVFPVKETGLKQCFFDEVWGSVVEKTGAIELNFPLLLSRGVDPSPIDSSYLYYPGVPLDENFEASLVAVNIQDHNNRYEVTLTSGDGTRRAQASCEIPAKTLHNKKLTELFPDAEAVLQGTPGLLVFHFHRKMNAYIQTWQRKTGALYGMDHLGILFGYGRSPATLTPEQRQLRFAERLEDPVVCYCRSVTQSEITHMLEAGAELKTICQATGAGTACLGCLPDLERLCTKNC